LRCHLILKPRTFTKTGSGQTYREHSKKGRRFLFSQVAELSSREGLLDGMLNATSSGRGGNGAAAGELQVRKMVSFAPLFMLYMMYTGRQARDRNRENSKEGDVFCQRYAAAADKYLLRCIDVAQQRSAAGGTGRPDEKEDDEDDCFPLFSVGGFFMSMNMALPEAAAAAAAGAGVSGSGPKDSSSNEGGAAAAGATAGYLRKTPFFAPGFV
jgi:hypothetical protein